MGAWERTSHKDDGLLTLEGFPRIQLGRVDKMSKTILQPKTEAPMDAPTIRECQRYVRSIQRNLDRAVEENDKKKIRWFTYLLTKRSRAVKILAIHGITVENEGKYTAGVDGIRVKEGKSLEVKNHNRTIRKWLLNKADIKKKPSAIRRTYIKKLNGKLRPLGIPTLLDRVIQDMVRTAIEPITEYYASDNSYGFRPKRNCHDAIGHLFNKLARRGSKQWIVEGDISGCFDNIAHDHILNNLEKWNTPEYIRLTIGKMLKAKIFEQGTDIENETGTPQGGVLSPMLANVALTTLDEYGRKYRDRNQSNPIVRYADDFVVVCKTKEEAEKRKEEIREMLEVKIGLTLSEEKTTITNIHQGFNFLGFNIRKYKYRSPKNKYHEVGKLLIKPQIEKVQSHLWKIKQVLKANKQAKQESIIRMLNPIRQGWAMYYRFVVSKDMFTLTENRLWEKLWMWVKRRHPSKSKRWIAKRYFMMEGERAWRFRTKDAELINIEKIPIVRYVIIKSGMRLHDGSKEASEYWKKREYVNSLNQIYSIKIEKLFKRQNGMCIYCEQPITAEQIEKQKIHLHHFNPRSQGGDERPNNLRLLHQQCHSEAHSKMSREQMSYWAKMKGNYIKKENIDDFAKAEMKEGKMTAKKVEVKVQKLDKALQRKRIALAKRSAQMLKEGRV